jgi:hypothetical protein
LRQFVHGHSKSNTHTVGSFGITNSSESSGSGISASGKRAQAIPR